MIYALDTNTVIHYLRKDLNVLKRFNNAVINRDNIAIPKVVDYEIRRGFRIYPAPKKETAYSILISEKFCCIAEMDLLCWERAEHVYKELYQKRFTVGDLDVLIAAICLKNGYALVTGNTKDFENIADLSVTDWQKGD